MKPRHSGSYLYRRLLTYAVPHWRVFVLAVVAMVVFAATDTGFAALMKPMLDGNFVERDPDMVRFVPLALITLFLFRGISGFASRYCMTWIGRCVIQRLRTDLFHQLLHLPVSFHDRTPSGRLLSRMTFDVEQVAEATSNAITILIRDSLTMLFLLAYMLWVSVWLTALFLITGPVLVLIIRYVSRRFRGISHRIQESMGELTQFSEEIIHGHKLVKSFTSESSQQRRFQHVNERNRKLHLKMAIIQGSSTPIVQFLAASILSLVVYLATIESDSQDISVGVFVSFIAAIMLLMQPLKRLTNINASLQRGIAAANSIFELLDYPTELDDGDKPLSRATGAIEFRAVHFTYEATDSPALMDVSFTLEPGQTIALVGRSGSGKTTLVSLIERFYEPQNGQILLDGQPLQAYRLADLRKQISVVGQDVVLFNDSIANNIAYGRSEEITGKELEAVAQAAHALEFIQKLPQGFDTCIGDRGVLLSGGQRQRIAIARAILKDAPVLILDEATSSLDSESEKLVQDALEKLTQNRTSIIIAHRLSTVERADRILVFDHGRIVETGTHEELLKRNKLYADLYRIQFNLEISGERGKNV